MTLVKKGNFRVLLVSACLIKKIWNRSKSFGKFKRNRLNLSALEQQDFPNSFGQTA